MNKYIVYGEIMLSVETAVEANSPAEALAIVQGEASHNFSEFRLSQNTVDELLKKENTIKGYNRIDMCREPNYIEVFEALDLLGYKEPLCTYGCKLYQGTPHYIPNLQGVKPYYTVNGIPVIYSPE